MRERGREGKTRERREKGKGRKRTKESKLLFPPFSSLPIPSPVSVLGVYRKLVAGSIPPISSSSRASAASAAVSVVGLVGVVAGVVVVVVAAEEEERRRRFVAASSPSAAAGCTPPFLPLRLVVGAIVEIFLLAAETVSRDAPGVSS